jgi:hypothetical protein
MILKTEQAELKNLYRLFKFYEFTFILKNLLMHPHLTSKQKYAPGYGKVSTLGA